MDVDLDKLSRNEQKAIVKEAIKEWMDERAEDFGKLTLKWIGGTLLGFCIYLVSSGMFK